VSFLDLLVVMLADWCRIARAIMLLLEKKTKKEWAFPGKETQAQDHAHAVAHSDTLVSDADLPLIVN
jgi:hypothetical protein